MSLRKIKRQNSLECTCETLKLIPQRIHKKCNARCDFCSERSFIKTVRSKSFPVVSILSVN